MELRSFKNPNRLQLVLAVLLLGLIGLVSARPVRAEGTLISAPNRVDMVHDPFRNILYITSGGEVLRYSLATQQFLPSFQLGGNLKGIDLSPDGNTLAVADDAFSSGQNWIYLVNLQTGTPQKVAFTLDFMEGGTFSVAFGNDGNILITSRFQGSGWVPLRKYSSTSGATTTLWSVRQDTMLNSSADGSVIGFAENNESDGPWGRYRVSDGNIVERTGYTDGTGWDNFEIGTNRNGTQFAIPTYGGTFVYDANFTKIATLGQYAGPEPTGVVYNPTQDIVYFAWAQTGEVRAFDTTNFTQVRAYNFEYTFPFAFNNQAYTPGRLKISRDGGLLFALVDGGIRYVGLDVTPPSVVASVSPTPNVSGWNNSDVTVSWSVGDGESGIASSSGCQTQTLTNETAGVTLTCSAMNGNGQTTSQSVTVRIDKTPPVVSCTPATSPNANGWYNSGVLIRAAATDALSGIGIGQSAILQAEGAGQSSTCYVTDKAGNIGTATATNINIDKTPPTVTCAPTTSPNANGWYNSDVPVVTTATDALSGIPNIFPVAILTQEGAGQSLTCSAVDRAGNTGTATASNINIDKSPPQMIVGRTAPNSNSWNNTDVTVTFGCTDPLSGVASSSGPSTLSNEGANQSVTGTCADKAGNTVTQVVSNINIDKTPPTVTCAPKTSPNANGWYNTDVLVVPITYADALSGVGGLGAPVLDKDGAGQSATCFVMDRAGNTGTATVSNINIDKTQPQITVSRTPPNANGWNNTAVTVTFGCTDPLSGVASSSGPSTLSNEGANQSVTGTCTDKAGNTATQVVSNINIDKTVPTITGAPTTSPNANGWYNSNVVVHFTAADALSGIDTVTPDQTLSTDGTGQSAKGTAKDKAGNTANTTVSKINIDKTKPTVTITSPQAKDYVRSARLNATWTARDALSGLATNSGKLDGNSIRNGQEIEFFNLSLGSHTITVDAFDKAGNSASVAVTFKVVADIHSLREALKRACDLHWIDKMGECQDLDHILQDAEESIQHSKFTAAKEKLNSFIKELDTKKGRGINQQAYDLLKGDALYVISSLP